jgi:Toprim domain
MTKSATEILRNNRITTASSALGRYYAMCPQCSTKRKTGHQKLKCLGVTIGTEGVKFGCNHCDWQGGEFYESAGTDRNRSVRTAPEIVAEIERRDNDETRKRSAPAIAVWDDAGDPRVPRVKRYLDSRGIELSDDIAGRVVRFHPACPWRGDDGDLQRRPAMITAFRSITNDRLVAVHRTLLSDDGRKLGRKMLGPVAGAAMKIHADVDVEQGLTVGEGFETCLAGRQLGFRPVWALGSANAIGAFPVLSGIDALTILAETDDSGDNARNARKCARAWVTAGREASIVMPGIAGDMNDLVMP